MHIHQQIRSLRNILPAALRGRRIRSELPNQRRAVRGVQCPHAGRKNEILRSILLVNFILVRQIVANRAHAEVARLDQRLYRLHRSRLKRCPPVLVQPRRLRLKICRILRQLGNRRRVRLVGNRHKRLRTPLRPARIAIHLDKPVIEIHRRIVLHPGNPKRHPLRVIARLVIANQMHNRFRLPRFRISERLSRHSFAFFK